jgi:hypothetical protein
MDPPGLTAKGRVCIASDFLYNYSNLRYEWPIGPVWNMDEWIRTVVSWLVSLRQCQEIPQRLLFVTNQRSGNGGRIQWVSGRPGEAPAYAGTDFIIARDGRIAALYLFFDKLP